MWIVGPPGSDQMRKARYYEYAKVRSQPLTSTGIAHHSLRFIEDAKRARSGPSSGGFPANDAQIFRNLGIHLRCSTAGRREGRAQSVLDNSRCEYRSLGVMANTSVATHHEILLQPQPTVRQVLHNADEHLQPQVVFPPSVQLNGAHQLWYVQRAHSFLLSLTFKLTVVGSATCEYLSREQGNSPLRMQESTIQYHLIAFLVSGMIPSRVHLNFVPR